MRYPWFPKEVEQAFEECGVPFEEYVGYTDQRIVSKLVELLKEKPDKFVRVARGLGKCGAQEAVQSLRQKLGATKDEYELCAAAHALGEIANPLPIRDLRPLLERFEDRVRLPTAWALARMGERSVGQSIDHMNREESLLWWDYYAATLYECGEQQKVLQLIKERLSLEGGEAQTALSALRKIKSRECLELVKEYVAQTIFPLEYEVLLSAEILAELGDFSEIPRIGDILQHGDDEMRLAAAELCSRLRLKAFTPVLRQQLGVEKVPSVCKEIRRSLDRIAVSPVGVVQELTPVEPKKPIEVITEINKRLSQRPSDIFLWNLKAKKEIEFFRAQLTSASEWDRFDCLRHLGYAYRALGEWADAEKCFGEVLAAKPRDTIALFGLAQSQGSRGDWSKEVLDRLLRVEATTTNPIVNLYDWPGNDLYKWLGRCHLELGNHRKAIKSLEKCILLNNGIQEGRELLARAELACGNLRASLRLLQEEIQLHPLEYSPRLYLAAISHAVGDLPKETQLLREVDQLSSGRIRLADHHKAEIERQVHQASKQQQTGDRGKQRWTFWRK